MLVHAQHGVLHAGHAGGAEGLGQGVHMGVGEEGAADLDAGVGHCRAVGVEEVLLSFPAGVAGVAGVVDVGEVGRRVVVGEGAALLVVNLHKGLAAVSGSCLCGQLFAAGQQRVDVRAGIGHLTEFHREKSFPGRESPFQYHTHLITFGRKKKDFEHM